jgi:hypothetical protein
VYANNIKSRSREPPRRRTEEKEKKRKENAINKPSSLKLM